MTWNIAWPIAGLDRSGRRTLRCLQHAMSCGTPTKLRKLHRHPMGCTVIAEFHETED